MSDSVQPATDHTCRCGRPYALIGGIQGRQEEALCFVTRDGRVQTVQPVVFDQVMDNMYAAGWQILQKANGLEILLVGPHEIDRQALVANMRTALTAQGDIPATGVCPNC